MNKWGIGVVGLAVFTVAAICVSSFVNAAPQASVSSNLKVNVGSVLSLTVVNCDNSSGESLTLSLIPTPTGTFKSDCQNATVDTNAPGYSLLAKSGGPSPIVTNPSGSQDFSTCGVADSFTAPHDGLYTLEVWGAQGGDTARNKGGNGGYSVGKINLKANDVLSIYVGCRGRNVNTATGSGGWNGGGQGANSGSNLRAGGGGATDIRINGNSLFNRVIVAGGGGAGAISGLLTNTGGVGGGLEGTDGSPFDPTAPGTSGKKGTQISGGAGGYWNISDANANGRFGIGGNGTIPLAATTSLGGGGGGGWYGGGGGASTASGCGGGGSGWVHTASSFMNWQASNPTDASQYLLDSNYYLTGTRTVTGNTLNGMPNPADPNANWISGKTGDGYAKISWDAKYEYFSGELVYQNPLPPNLSTAPIIPSVTHTMSSPGHITPNHWGFGVTSNSVDLSASPSTHFDSVYTIDNSNNKYARMPTNDTLIFSTDNMPVLPDVFKFWYGVNLDHSTLAGLYQTTITYTAVANDVPFVPTPCETEDYECIIYTINTQGNINPNIHEIGLSGYVAGISDHTYDWDVFVDGKPITDCRGTNHCFGTGGWDSSYGQWGGNARITITGLTEGIHQIKILPHNGPEPGWGNAFSMSWNADIVSIDAPLTTMAFAPKPSESTTDASDMFSGIFSGCQYLTTPATFLDTYKLPNTITNLSSFMDSIHSSNSLLTSPMDLTGISGWLNGNNSITDLSYFMSGAHYANDSLIMSINLTPISGWFNNNNSVIDLSYFLEGIHENSDRVVTPLIPPAWSLNNVEDLSFFMFDAYYNTPLITTVDLTPLSNLLNANNTVKTIEYFFLDTYYGVSSLSEPMDLSPISGWFNHNNSITNMEGFFYQVYTNYPPTSRNNITKPMDLRPLKNWFYHNESVENISIFLCQTYWGSFMDKPMDLRGLENWFYHNNSIINMDYFLGDVHLDDSHLTTPLDLTPIKNWFYQNNSVEILDLFRGTHDSNTSLSSTIDLTPLADWFYNSSALRQLTILNGTYLGSTSLVQPADLSPLSGWYNLKTSNTNLVITIVPSTHDGNTSLTSPVDLRPLAGWFNNNETFSGVSFYNFTHYDNPNIVLSGQTLLPNWLKTAKRSDGTFFWNDRHNIERTFWMTNPKSGDTAEVKFMDGSVLSSLGTPTYPKYVYYNRTGISAPSGWK